jgi:hypothetical protein
MATDLGRRDSGLGGPEEQPPPWQRAAGIGIPVVAVAVLCALKPEIVTGTFSSAESMLRVGALLAGWVLFSWLMRRVIPNPLVRTVVVAVPAIALLWWNVAPYFKDDVKITDSFPEASTTAGTVASPSVIDRAPPAVDAPPTPAPPPQPVQLTTGRFRGLDGHRGSGEAAIFRQPDGSAVVAFRDLSVSSVPDPVLYLVPGADKEGLDGAIRLARFDADKDRYDIPAGTDLDRPMTVLIWCQRFSVPVAGATQKPV